MTNDTENERTHLDECRAVLAREFWKIGQAPPPIENEDDVAIAWRALCLLERARELGRP